jgi:ppGpp synthetase/RelA/SpoT-type nucleotidyltranferase
MRTRKLCSAFFSRRKYWTVARLQKNARFSKGTSFLLAKQFAMNPTREKADFDLSSFKNFMRNPWTNEIVERYALDAVTADHAVQILIDDLKLLNAAYLDEKSRVLFTSLDGRVKGKRSFFKKLYENCRENCKRQGFDRKNLQSWYSGIHDIAGVRFSCPYFDEVENAIQNRIRPFLESRGYGTNLSNLAFKDKNYLDKGDKNGYRSYHFS